jgi:DMSO/TMAO reductase YedYZ molybdopterin-dependent catalytic subunit
LPGPADVSGNPQDGLLRTFVMNDARHVADSRTWRRTLGALAGLVSALAGLAVAELASVPGERSQSPILDVGDRVVDGVPVAVKTLAIDWFGTKDKIALLFGIASLLALYAAVVGVVAVSRRWRLAIVGVALFGLVGAYASQTTRRAAPWYAVTPSLIGGLVAALVLTWLRRQLLTARRSDDPHVDDDRAGDDRVGEPAEGLDRRRFMVATAATASAAAVVGITGRTLATRSSVGAQRDALRLPLPRQPLAPVPDAVTAPADGVSPFFTPNADFYRIDTALTVPRVSVDSWRLTVTGLVDREIELSYSDLVARAVVESDITLTCVSNEVGGKLMGTARWLGVRLDDLLAEAGIDPAADQIVGRAVDGYTCGFPVGTLDGRDALIAIGMNGEPLPLEHGYPARLIVPGLYGYVSATKWLTEIELTRFDRFDQYWVERGWVDQAPIKVQSRIDTPRGLSKSAAGTVAVAGVAWAQTRGIDRVEIQIDDGAWVEATLADELNVVTWRQWSYAWEATPGRHTLRVRATERTSDGRGAIQTDERTEPFPSGATGQHQIVVMVE